KREPALRALDAWKAETEAEIGRHTGASAELAAAIDAAVAQADAEVRGVEQACAAEIQRFGKQADAQVAERTRVFEQQRDRALQQVDRIASAAVARIRREDELTAARTARVAGEADQQVR